MKISLEILKNEKFLLNLLFDILYSLRAAVRKYWLFFPVVVFKLLGGHIYFRNKKFYSINTVVKFGSLRPPDFQSGVILLPPAEPKKCLMLEGTFIRKTLVFLKKTFKISSRENF